MKPFAFKPSAPRSSVRLFVAAFACRAVQPALGLMNRWIAGIVLSLATLAHATSPGPEGLNLYALIDAGASHTRISGAGTSSSKTEFTTGAYGPNFIGLSFQKPASQSLVAGIAIEQGFLLSSSPRSGERWAYGSGDFLNRQTNLFVKSIAGEFVAGTQPNLAFQGLLIGEPRSGSHFGSALAMVMGTGELNAVDESALSYRSPSFSGLKIAAQIIPESGQTPGTIRRGTRTQVSYSTPMINLALSHISSERNAQSALNLGSFLSAAVRFNELTFKALAATQRTAAFQGALTTVGVGGAYAPRQGLTIDLGVYASENSTADIHSRSLGLGIQKTLTDELSAFAQIARVANRSSSVAIPYHAALAPDFADRLLAGQTASSLNLGLIYRFQ